MLATLLHRSIAHTISLVVMLVGQNCHFNMSCGERKFYLQLLESNFGTD